MSQRTTASEILIVKELEGKKRTFVSYRKSNGHKNFEAVVIHDAGRVDRLHQKIDVQNL